MTHRYLFGVEFRVQDDWCDKYFDYHWATESKWYWDIWCSLA